MLPELPVIYSVTKDINCIYTILEFAVMMEFHLEMNIKSMAIFRIIILAIQSNSVEMGDYVILETKKCYNFSYVTILQFF